MPLKLVVDTDMGTHLNFLPTLKSSNCSSHIWDSSGQTLLSVTGGACLLSFDGRVVLLRLDEFDRFSFTRWRFTLPQELKRIRSVL